MASISLGNNVAMREGTCLIKIQSIPNVYAVEPGGVIRWITTQELAEGLYGDGWNNKIKDVSDAFFPDYTKGNDITELSHPTGSLIKYEGAAEVYYIENGKRYISSSVFTNNMYQEQFIINNVPNTIVYTEGSYMPQMSRATMMFP